MANSLRNWESETASDAEVNAKEVEFIRVHRSNDPAVGYNTRLYPTIAREVARLQAESVIPDGEVVAIDEHGPPSFQALHHQSAHTLVYYVFDLLHLDGHDLTATPLDERRDLLAGVLKDSRLLRSASARNPRADREGRPRAST